MAEAMQRGMQAVAMLGSLAFLLVVVAGISLLIFWVIMVFDVATTPHLQGFERFLWILVLFGFWAAGALVYMIWGRRTPEPQRPLTTSAPDPEYFRRVQERLKQAKTAGYGGRVGA